MDENLVDDELDLGKYWLVLKRQWKVVLGTFLIITTGTLVFALSRKPVYEAESKLLFKSDRSTSLTGLGEALGRLEPLTFQANPLDTQVEILKSNPILEVVIGQLDLRDDDGQLLKPSDLAQSLTVRAMPGTDVLSISYKSEDAETAALVSNKMAEVFISESIQDNRAEAIAARDFLSQQLPRTEAAVNQAEINLQEFKERNQVIALEQEASSLVDISFDLQRQIDAARSQISTIDSTLVTYQNRLNIQSPQLAIVLAALNQSEGVQQVLAELQNVEEEIATSSALFTSDSQIISRLAAQRDNLQGVLSQRIEQVINNRAYASDANLQLGDLQTNLIGEVVALDAQRQGLINQISTLSAQIDNYSNRMSVLPGLEKQQSELERELMVAQTTYQTLLSRFQESQVAEGQTIGNVRLISSATVPENAAGSNKRLTLAAGMLSGILLGIALAFILDLTNRSVKTVREAKEIFGYSVLGIIPTSFAHEKHSLYPLKLREHYVPDVTTLGLQHPPTSEAYRILQANLSFLNFNSLQKSIVVTSSLPNEGKSEVAVNLAATIAHTGRRVLLVDADLRNPVQHKIWNLENSVGLCDLSEDHTRFREITHKVSPNLEVLPTGSALFNPVDILASTLMPGLILKLKEAYEFIIFDAPSLLGQADAAVLGKLSDGILLVVRLGTVDYDTARSTQESLIQSGQNVLGMVINGVSMKNDPGSRFYYNSSEALDDINGMTYEARHGDFLPR